MTGLWFLKIIEAMNRGAIYISGDSNDERYHIEKENSERKLTPHVAELINVKEPSCNEEDYTGDSICKICKFLIVKGEKISKTICEAADNDTVNNYKVLSMRAIDSYHCYLFKYHYSKIIKITI